METTQLYSSIPGSELPLLCSQQDLLLLQFSYPVTTELPGIYHLCTCYYDVSVHSCEDRGVECIDVY